MFHILPSLLLMLALSACRQTPHDDDRLHGRLPGKVQRESWEAEKREEASRFTDADLQRMVDRLFVEPDPQRANFHGLLWAGQRPVPWLIQALKEPRTRTTVFFREGFHLNGVSPFERICKLLSYVAAAPNAAATLVPYLDHPDRRFRQEAAMLLGRIGTPECLGPVRKALADGDPNVREFALIGLQGMEGHPRDDGFLRAAYAAVLPMMGEDVLSNSGPAEVLMAIDPVKATPVLESPRYFSIHNHQLASVLKALDRDDVRVPIRMLRPLMATLETLARNNRVRGLEYSRALHLYARNPDSLAEKRFRDLLDSPDTAVSSAAAAGLETLAGMDAEKTQWDAWDNQGFAGMTKPQQYAHAVRDYKNEVENGGHSQYFYNSAGEVYRTVIEGLEAIGAPKKAAILKSALGVFGTRLPAANIEDRRDQVLELTGEQEGILAEADRRFYASEERAGERIDVLLALYALAHKGDFREVSKARAVRK